MVGWVVMESDRASTIAAVGQFSDDSVKAQPTPGLLAYGQAVPTEQLDGGEIVILALKPSMWYLVLVSIRWLAVAALVVISAPWLVGVYPAFSSHVLSLVTQSAVIITAARLILALLQWSSRLYVLTNRRVMCCRGLMRVALFEAPLVQVRNTYVNIRRVEKLCNVGSIGFSLTGGRQIDASWEQVSNPREIHERVRRAIEKALDEHSPY